MSSCCSTEGTSAGLQATCGSRFLGDTGGKWGELSPCSPYMTLGMAWEVTFGPGEEIKAVSAHRWFQRGKNPHTGAPDWLYKGGYFERNFSRCPDIY